MTLQEQSSYVEARLGLIEELFAQIFGMFPPEAAEAKANAQPKPSLVLVQPSNIILP